MTRDEILQTITGVFREVLDNDGIRLQDSTTAADVPEWDSLTHIQLVVAVERQFHIRFASREIRGWNNVGELVDTVAAKLDGK